MQRGVIRPGLFDERRIGEVCDPETPEVRYMLCRNPATAENEHPPGHCLVLEDALAGIEAARRAGMQVIGIGSAQALPGVHPILENLVGVTADDVISGMRG